MQSEVFKSDYAISKHRLVSMGLSHDDLQKPLVVVLYEDGCQSHLVNIKLGASASGGGCIFLCMPSCVDYCAKGQSKRPLMMTRESIADLTENLLGIYNADSVCIVANSEMAAAGMIIGAIRKNVPLVFLPSQDIGFMHAKATLTQAEVSCAKKGQTELDFLDRTTAVRSLELDNFNSLAIFCEAAGISIFGAFACQNASDKILIARESGKRAVYRAENLSYPRKNFTEKSIKNGIAAHISCGGTLASLVHIIAIAKENGVSGIDFDYIAKVGSQAQQLVKIRPQSDLNIYEFANAGGVRGVLKQLSQIQKLIATDVSYGEATLGQVFDGLVVDSGIICDAANGGVESSSVVVLRGNAFENSLVKKIGVLKKSDKIKAKAVCFDSEDLCRNAILNDGVKDDSVVIVKGQAAAINGGPILDIESAVLAKGLNGILLVSDGRMVELGTVASVCMCQGEAIFLAAQTGDVVDLDFKKGKFNIDISAKEANNRLKREAKASGVTGSLLRYVDGVGTANEGYVLKSKFK
ncbi:MAG: dihydroxy-acid dehydratase [Firmicutes bacterium]|nr:dihydroxy-acid dehydratase [Bacillota bacterium]